MTKEKTHIAFEWLEVTEHELGTTIKIDWEAMKEHINNPEALSEPCGVDLMFCPGLTTLGTSNAS